EYGGVDGTAWRCYAVLAFPLHRTLRKPFYFTRHTARPFSLPDYVAVTTTMASANNAKRVNYAVRYPAE
ncbi:MAG: hypothetical protein J2P36_39430, partial [Ktedonobacteraceae bacterium]|nr:hypothetical protein [Ktedonobacteraceae bacterium]